MAVNHYLAVDNLYDNYQAAKCRFKDSEKLHLWNMSLIPSLIWPLFVIPMSGISMS